MILGFQYYSTRKIWEWDFPSWNVIDLYSGTARDEPKPKQLAEVLNGTDVGDRGRYDDEDDQPSLSDRINRILDAI